MTRVLRIAALAIVLAAMGARWLHGQDGEAAAILTEGASITRELSPGQIHTYAIHLVAGQFLHAVVLPRGVDVAVTLVAPDGHDLRVVDLSRDDASPEPLLVVAETAGRYEIKVFAVMRFSPGRYTIVVTDLRAAEPNDMVRVAAMRALETGARLGESGDPQERERAIEPLAAARAAFHAAGDREQEARAWYVTASSLWNLRRRQAALDAVGSALALYRELGDEVGIVPSATLRGLLLDIDGDSAGAMSLFEEAQLLNRRIGSGAFEANTLNAVGVASGRVGNSERAIAAFQDVLRVAQRLRMPIPEMMALANLGIATKNIGDYRLSLKYYEQALALARTRSNRDVEAATLNNVGILYRILGEFAAALESHVSALALAREIGNQEHEARALNNLGLTYYRLGDFRKALEHHQLALGMRQRMTDLSGQAASLDGAGMARHRLGDSPGAIENLNEALRIRRATGERGAESAVLQDLAAVERDRGDLTAALDYIDAAVQITDSLRGQVISPDLRASYVAAEHERYELYIDVLMQLHDEQRGAGFDARALEANERGRARVLLESLIEARADVRQGVDATLLERERAYLRQLDAASTRLSRAIGASASAREADAARAALDSVTTDYRQLQVRIRQESPAYAALTQPPPLSTGEIQRDLIDQQTLLLEFALGEKRSWLWMVTPTAISSFVLPPRKEIETAARRVYALLTARQPVPDETAAARSARIAAADREWRRQSTELGRMLLGSAAAHQGDAWRGKRLLVVAADVLEYVPFAALIDPVGDGQPLVADHEIVNLPSASVLAVLRHETPPRSQPTRQLAVLADPVFEADDPRVVAVPGRVRPISRAATRSAAMTDALGMTITARALRTVDAAGVGGNRAPSLSRLPFSREEARSISALVPASQRLEATGFLASRATATSGGLAAYRFVHFATHGFLNSEQPELSGLVLSLVNRDGTPQDGFLRLSDIYNLRLPAEVVVLSACQTALGKEIRGEGLIGLTRGFMYAGARRVVASLWQVDDLATAELMRLFYRGMLKDGLRPAAALRAAQRQLARQPRWASPFFWSPFVLQGEWR